MKPTRTINVGSKESYLYDAPTIKEVFNHLANPQPVSSAKQKNKEKKTHVDTTDMTGPALKHDEEAGKVTNPESVC